MTIKELSQLYYLNREIERDKARLEELYAKATNTSPSITGMPRAPGVTDKVSRYAAEIADLKGIIEANVQRCFYELNRLNRYINDVPDAHIRLILSLRFVNGLPWRQVAASISGNNTEDSVRKACVRFLEQK
jgi:hypothetical protein